MAKAPSSPLDRIKQLDEEKQKIIKEAKEEAITKINALVGELNELGDGDYKLTNNNAPARKSKRGPCPHCKFETVPHHDGRQHRSQGEKKKPFSQKELEALELTKV